MTERVILRHAYVSPDDDWPVLVPDDLVHAQGRSQGVGLDVWWLAVVDE